MTWQKLAALMSQDTAAATEGVDGEMCAAESP